MAELVAFVPGTHEADLHALLTTYLKEGAAGLKQAFDLEHDIPAAVGGMMGHLAQFAPPAGRLLLVIEGNAALGCGALRPIAPGVAEIKWMYLRPEARGRGLGRQLLEALLLAARQEGYQEVRLDTPGSCPRPTSSIAPPASLHAIPFLRARSRWSTTIAASSSVALWPT
jgi:GNAT superfamily N-acetyltransferase